MSARTLALSLVLAPTIVLALSRPAFAQEVEEKTAQSRKNLDALLDRWNDTATGDRLAQAIALCDAYLARAKGDDKAGELDFRLELTRLHLATGDHEAALKDANAAEKAAATANSDRKNEAKALYLLAYARSSQDRITKLATPEEQKKAADEFTKSFLDTMKNLSEATGGDDAAKKLVGEQNERVATASAINELGKPPKAIDKQDTTGVMIRLTSYPGKVVLVDFWATWCGPCMGELPNVLRVYAENHDRGLEVVGISLDKDRAKLDGRSRSRSIPWRQYFDGKGWGNEVAKRLGGRRDPADLSDRSHGQGPLRRRCAARVSRRR